MAYVPYDWQTGEKITEERLDYMENGIADASGEVFTVKCNMVEGVPEGTFIVTSDKTAIEIYNAAKEGKFINLLISQDGDTNNFSHMIFDYASKHSEGVEGVPDDYVIHFYSSWKSNSETQITLGFIYLTIENNGGGADIIRQDSEAFIIDLAGN